MTPQQPPKNSPSQQRPQKSRALTKQRRGFNAAMLTWISIAVVVALVAVIVIVYEVTSTNQKDNFGPISPVVYSELTGIPATVYNSIGVSSPAIAVSNLYQLNKQPAGLTVTVGGKKVPWVFYWGAEYCPFCAATRWGIIAALSRFGTFNGLYNMYSSSTDTDPNTPTFTFLHATYTSSYLGFNGYEVEDRNENPLMTTPGPVTALRKKYNPGGSFPFMDIDNHIFIVGAVFDPSVLAGTNQATVAANLDNASSPVTQAIVTEANYLTAGICVADKNAPALVCQSPGVKVAIAALAKLPD
jgi:heme/copper-type cytochrome/quinol oxidase subunit 2